MHVTRLTRPFPLVLAATLQSAAAAAGAPFLYHIDQRYGTIGFSVSSLGLFSSEGRFTRFGGDLLLDVDHPERTHIDVTVDTGAVETPLADETALLRSAAYFDVARYPSAHFVSTSIVALSPTRYVIHGELRLRGVTQPEDLDAVLQDRQEDKSRKVEFADFVIAGKLQRSAFGMVADRLMVSDIIKLEIRIRLTVGAAGNAE